MYGPQNVIIGSYFMLRITDHKEGQRNPSAPVDNAFRPTNFRSRSAMRGAEFHGNTRRVVLLCCRGDDYTFMTYVSEVILYGQ